MRPVLALLMLLSVGCRAGAKAHGATGVDAGSAPRAPKVATEARDAAMPVASAAATARIPREGPIPELEVQEVEATGRNPKGIVLSHDGKTLVVTSFGELGGKRNITTYDADTLAVRAQLDVPAVVVESVLSANDETLFASSFWGHSVLFVDLASGAVRAEVKAGFHPKVLALSKDGRHLFAANWSGESVTQIDVASATVVRTLKTGKNPRGLAVTSEGAVYAASFYGESIEVFRGADLGDKHSIKVCKCPRHLALSPDEKTLYISCLFKSELHALDLATETVTHRVPIGESPKSVSVSPDGRYVYSADYGLTRSISVVDTTSWTARVFPVPGMDRGSGVVALEDGEHAVVTGWYDAHIYKIGFIGSGGHPADAAAKIARWRHRPFSKDPGDGS